MPGIAAVAIFGMAALASAQDNVLRWHDGLDRAAQAARTTGKPLFVVLRWVEQHGYRKRLHKLAEERKFALELRISLVILCALAALATRTHVSIMLAGFSFGLALAGIGDPRRLARQLFAVNDGFLGPLFFVWVGAGLNLRDLGHFGSHDFEGGVQYVSSTTGGALPAPTANASTPWTTCPSLETTLQRTL